ncbi:hypothetical protein [Psychrobacter sp.]|uniref:hypothetical protein n=2 Tax=Moraxellaceae TaxID=468 RepID=UPI00356A087C
MIASARGNLETRLFVMTACELSLLVNMSNDLYWLILMTNERGDMTGIKRIACWKNGWFDIIYGMPRHLFTDIKISTNKVLLVDI